MVLERFIALQDLLRGKAHVFPTCTALRSVERDRNQAHELATITLTSVGS